MSLSSLLLFLCYYRFKISFLQLKLSSEQFKMLLLKYMTKLLLILKKNPIRPFILVIEYTLQLTEVPLIVFITFIIKYYKC